jgi:hypothetical protein
MYGTYGLGETLPAEPWALQEPGHEPLARHYGMGCGQRSEKKPEPCGRGLVSAPQPIAEVDRRGKGDRREERDVYGPSRFGSQPQNIKL